MQDEQYLARLRTHWKRQVAFPPMAIRPRSALEVLGVVVGLVRRLRH